MIAAFAPRGAWRNAHVQTLSAALPWGAPPRDIAPATAADLLLPLDDGDALVVRAWWQPEAYGAQPVVVLLHGVGGTSESRYLRRAAGHAYRRGFHVVRVNARGYGLGAPYARRVAHGALDADQRAVVQWCAAQPRVSAVHVIGFSLGGHVALHLAAACAAAPLPALRSVTAVSPPLDLTIVSRLFERPAIALYREHVLRGLRRDVLAHLARDPASLPVDASAVARWRQVREYDESVLAPVWGFASAADYYARSSAARVLGAITLPTLLLTATDDPMVPPEAVQPFLLDAGPGVHTEITQHGGHCGFAESWSALGRGETWATQRALEFIAAVAGAPESP